MEPRQLRYFLALVEAGTFTRAAAAIPLAQSALSTQIAALERSLGCRLVERTQSGVRLTEAGTALLAPARRILRDLDAAREEVHAAAGLVHGSVTLGAVQAMPILDLPAALRAFHRLYPTVDVHLREDGSVTMLRALSDGDLDLGLLTLPPGGLPAGVKARTVLEEPLVALVPAGHPAAGTAPVDLADLTDGAFVEFKPGSGLRAHVDHVVARAGLRRRIAFEVTQVDTLGHLVAQGLGVALLFRSAAIRLPDPGVVVLPLADTTIRSTFALVRSSRRSRLPAVDALHRHLHLHGTGAAG
jgi:DNA-binding transcriptional LysR family regulator